MANFDTVTMTANHDKKYVFIWSASFLSRLLSPLARELRRSYNIHTILFTYGETNLPSPKFYDFNKSDFAEIININELMKPQNDAFLSNAEIAEQANDLEKRLGVNIVDLIRTDRHLGIDFVSGANFHRSYYGDSANYRQTLDIALRLCTAFEDYLTQLSPLTVLVFPGSIATSALASMAKGLNIPWRWLIASPQNNLFYWCEEQAVRPIGFKAAYDRRFRALCDQPLQTSDGDPSPERHDSTPLRSQIHFATLRDRTRLIYLYRLFYKVFRTDLGHRVRRPGKMVIGRYKPIDLARQSLNRWLWLRRELKKPPVTPNMPDGTLFVFYPLHIEPESTLMVEAQHADNQLLVVDWLAKSVPPGWYVVVKEHPGATSPRPKGFWERIRAYPNVIVAATFEDSLDLVDRCEAVADINGSVGQQAAALGKPVIAFNKSYIATTMPHVLGVASYAEARAALRRIRDNDLPDQRTRLLAAQAFAEATRDCSIPVDDAALIEGVPGKARVADEEILRFVSSLLKSLPSFEPAIPVLNDDQSDAIERPGSTA